MTKAYLSIDIDGVLHSQDAEADSDVFASASRSELRAAGLLQHCELLASVMEPHPEIGLAVHSNWRHTHTLPRLQWLLHPLGGRIRAVAPPLILQREAAVLAMMLHLRIGPHQILLLDDQPGLFKLLRHRVITCLPRAGVSAPKVLDRLRARLNDLEGGAGNA